MILSAASYLDDETILKKLPFLTVDEINDILDRKATEEMSRFAAEENTDTQNNEGAENIETEDLSQNIE